MKQVGQDATTCDGDIKELRARQQNVSQQLEEKQANCQQMKQAVDALEGTVETLQESRQKVEEFLSLFSYSLSEEKIGFLEVF